MTSEHRFAELRDIAGPVSRETFGRLLEFERIFRVWSARMNLVAESTKADLWRRHMLDSAQILKIAPAGARSWVDIGSGGGFPGAVIAILLSERSGTSIFLFESNQKKAGFLRAALADLAPAAAIEPMRIEDAVHARAAPDVITARAVASLGALVEWTEPWLNQGAVALFHKGRDYREEIKLAHDTWNLDLIEHPSRINDDSVIIEIGAVSRR